MQFIDLKEQYRRYKQEIQEEMNAVLESAAFIRGPAVRRFEEEMADYLDVKHAIGCSSGTDAILLALLALDVKPGDEVLVPDFTFIATAEIVALLGCVPVFVDILPDTYNIDGKQLEKKITEKTKGIIPVSLYGQCADFDEINAVAAKHKLWVIEDGAQSFGALYKGKKSGGLTTIGTTSFFPAKPLGCYGDGGAVFTDDESLADKMRMLLNHGQSKRYHHSIIGINGRLDSLQAAILSVKLKHFDDEIAKKQQIAQKYSEQLKDTVTIPFIKDHNYSVWAQYTVRTPKRDDVTAALKEKNIPTAIHYPMPLHSQEAFAYLNNSDSDYPLSVEYSKSVISLPMHPFLEDADISVVTEAVKEALDG